MYTAPVFSSRAIEVGRMKQFATTMGGPLEDNRVTTPGGLTTGPMRR